MKRFKEQVKLQTTIGINWYLANAPFLYDGTGKLVSAVKNIKDIIDLIRALL